MPSEIEENLRLRLLILGIRKSSRRFLFITVLEIFFDGRLIELCEKEK